MTIKNPTKKKKYLGFFVKLFLLVAIGAGIWIYQYNALADARYELKELENKIVELEVENAELKNDLYKITDPSHLQEVASVEGMVIEENPNYLELSQWVSDSSY